jgi:hypothetical protein
MAKKRENDQAQEVADTGNTGENADPKPGTGDNPPIQPAPGKVAVVSKRRKGKTIFAVSGKPIVFDNEGKATVNEEDALYLKSCPDFIVG